MSSPETEFLLACLAAALLPTTLTFSVLVLVVSDQPLRTGFCFYIAACMSQTASIPPDCRTGKYTRAPGP